ncbi:MAG TPA: 4,5-DOPA dioxygenase extradiol [Alphaproteobacteria bacterium]|nr:4,5-DOPA dioxygenase extradiol [Alphaproteobacteria bacterium]
MAKMPALFVGHGSPMNTLYDNGYTRAWRALGEALAEKPRAILAISAHWYIRGTSVTAMTAPKTIHDFGGFPRELHEFRYPAEGEPGLAAEVQKLLSPTDVSLDQSWGLDHGSWSVLAHVFPNADVPVVQLSIDARQPAAWHFDLGRRLTPLRDEGVLILGSGNVVHNLRLIDRNAMMGAGGGQAYPWATQFESAMRSAIAAGDDASVIDYGKFGEAARLSVPTPEHYLPLLYVLGTRAKGEAVSFPVEGIDLASISMLSVKLG